jgi:pimeloyl-ACP methyl ester carboxylesterase
MKETPAILPPYERCTDTELPAGIFDPPQRFVDPQNEFRLIPLLREAAQTRNPYQILARSAAAFSRAQHPIAGSLPLEDIELGNALADLAVTGRRAYSLLKTPPLNALDDLALASDASHLDLHHPPLTEAELLDTVGGLLATLVTATPAESASTIAPALDRAFRVAWALRGSVAQRTATRASLGWIAVSGEDDMPHRPTNVPPPAFEQHEIPVTVPGRGAFASVTVQTRFFIASPPGVVLPSSSHTLRELPPEPQPHVPDGNHVILFLHGHSSGAEEALAIIPHLHMAGLKQGKQFSIISFDLPNNGYSESFNHEKVAITSATSWPAGLAEIGPVLTPVLDFIEDFIVAFVDALDLITPIKHRFSGVIGGSLGGNMGLRLGRRNPLPAWLDAGIVSWNAACVWKPMIHDLLMSQAPGRCQNNWNASETPASRHAYFHEVYEKDAVPVIVPHTQPELWYSDGWKPCKRLHIKFSRIARREIYSANFRQWHWRVAGEQLIYSHVDRADHAVAGSPWRYTQNTVSHLLIGSANDNFTGSNIFDATRILANHMVATPGRSLFLRDTGHSVHFERPAFLAKQITGFLPSNLVASTMPTMALSMEITCIYREAILSVGKKKRTGPPKLGRILMASGIDHTQNVPFSLTVAECVSYIDYGCELFVRRTDGSKTTVHVVRKGHDRPYIATGHDKSDANNLLSLPKC